jgi:predicted nucleic acid-binding protein
VEIREPQPGIRLGIGAGEDEAIALATELGNAALLIDDRKGREAARARGIVTVGTLGILDLADEAGWLDFADALKELRKTSFHVDENVTAVLLIRSKSRKTGPATD